MEFQFTEEQLMIQKAAKDFAEQECKPGVIERDEKQIFPKDQVESVDFVQTSARKCAQCMEVFQVNFFQSFLNRFQKFFFVSETRNLHLFNGKKNV